ncbi:MAG: 30S ribosomal protein S16 [Candidatus Paceibacterota bacterium]
MLKIRLQRIGKRGQAYFRVVVIERTTKPKGKYLELLGSYDPHKNEVTVKADRVKHWMEKGAQLSPTVNNLLVSRSIIEGEKVQVWKAKKKKGGEVEAAAPAAKAAPPKEEQAEEPKEEVKKEETAEPTKEETPAPAQG